MSRPSNNREMEMKTYNNPNSRNEPNRYNQGYNEERPRTSSAAALQFQRLKQLQQNEIAAQQSRRESRASKGLNPDVPKPRVIHTCKHFIIVEKPKD